jgi:hypothetical protein
VLLPGDHDHSGSQPYQPPPGLCWISSGAQVLPCIRADDEGAAASLLARVRLVAERTRYFNARP